MGYREEFIEVVNKFNFINDEMQTWWILKSYKSTKKNKNNL